MKASVKDVAAGSTPFLIHEECGACCSDESFRIINDIPAGAIVKGFRHHNELSQIQLAEKMGTTSKRISRVERGLEEINVTLAKRFAAVFKANYRAFL